MTKLVKNSHPVFSTQRTNTAARVLELHTCPSLPFHFIMSKQEVREEALLNIRCVVKGYHLYQSISINLSIVIENRYQSITTRNFAIDWPSIININRLIDIDWYRLISIVVDYRFHRLDTPGYFGGTNLCHHSHLLICFFLQ